MSRNIAGRVRRMQDDGATLGNRLGIQNTASGGCQIGAQHTVRHGAGRCARFSGGLNVTWIQAWEETRYR
jgi:hypothetical protein